MSIHLTDRDDLAMMQDPDRWPMWPVLPVKNHALSPDGSWPLMGILIDVREHRSKVFLVNMLELTTGPLEKQLEGTGVKHYDDLEAIVAAGWIVD